MPTPRRTTSLTPVGASILAVRWARRFTYNDLLGQCERIAFQVVIDQVTGTTPTLAVEFWHGSDGRNFSQKTILQAAASIGSTATVVWNLYELGTNPSHGFGQIRLTLAGTSPQAHIKVWATGRGLS